MFHKIEPTSLSQQAVAMIRGAIVSGELSPGEHLNERNIARQMGISRIPVREAIQQLEYEGLVISMPNRGSFVRYFSKTDIKEIFDLRAVLEGLACQILIKDESLREADFELLEDLVQEQQKAMATNDYDGWVESEIGFHTFLMEKANSKRLLKTWQNMHVQCLFATRNNWGIYRRAYGSHPVILDALRCGPADRLIPLHQEIYSRIGETALRLAPAESKQSGISGHAVE